MAESSEINWQPKLSERTTVGPMVFDIAKAKNLIVAKPRPIEMKTLSTFKPMYYLMDIKVDYEKARQTDLKVPVIAVNFEGKPLIIDGWHRYASALKQNLPEIAVVTLGDDELPLVRIR